MGGKEEIWNWEFIIYEVYLNDHVQEEKENKKELLY